MLYLVNHEDTYLELPYKLCHNDQQHIQGIPAFCILLEIIRPGSQIQRIEKLVAQLLK